MSDFIFNYVNQVHSKLPKKAVFSHSNDAFNRYLIVSDFNRSDDTIFVVCANLYEAQKYYDALSMMVDSEKVLFYPADQILTSMMALGSPEFRSERLYTLNKLLSQEKFIVVTTQFGCSLRTLKTSDFMSSVKTLKKGHEYEIDEIVKFLVNSGYQRTFTVDSVGTFSVRGHIIDIYTQDHINPFRLDFFDNLLEEIKLFDIDTQRSFEAVDTLTISALTELFYTSKMKEDAIKRIDKHFDQFTLSDKEQEKLSFDLELLETRRKLETLSYYIPFFNTEETTILDFSKHKKVYAIDVSKMKINEQEKVSDLETYAQTMHGKAFLEQTHYLPFSKIEPHFDYAVEMFNQMPNQVSLEVIPVNNYQGNLNLLYHDYLQNMRKPIILSIQTPIFKTEVLDFLREKRIKFETSGFNETKLYITDDVIYGAFETKEFVCIDEATIYNAKIQKRIQYRSVLNQSTKIRHIDELKILDYVVHYDYGIGRYMGLKTMKMSKEKRDYLHIIYANEEALYVPVDQIDLVLKYSSQEGMEPKLSKLGSKQWDKTKASVRKKIKDLSDRLIALYAKREQAVGFKFSRDNEIQESFDRDFEYRTTKDQEKAIIETKHDMETSKPMDRLICGDVGFGKTEVALRASFKAVLDTKQVFYLVPTTILARQHYYTFKKRFDKYGANVALLTRFVKPKQQKEILEKLKKGLIDVVIGTHRLLSKDVVFKDLGLLIVDEEQRFGVEHKERIKEIKVNVDTLTLSATPIPRTLQMSMMGLKDLSMIETPPLNRYPVQTYVVEKQDALIKEAVYREIARGGQIFYLYNRVEDMERVVLKLQRLIPNARIIHAHGKMNRDHLERVISDFVDHEYDVLVSTTIIETGVDIPNTNTLIIDGADKLGLSQLYQIRGRVGRSDKIAYAYLFYDKGKHVTDESRKRLEAIQDFTALGSGYKIALRDLSIRGAGDILGAEQSGFIDSVGVELYMKLLNETLNQTEEPVKKVIENEEVYAPRHINETYIDNDAVRIEIHKQIGRLNRLDDLYELRSELIDRFGKFDEDLNLYMYEKLFKALSYQLGVKKMNRGVTRVSLTVDMDKSKLIQGEILFELASTFRVPVSLGYIKECVEIHMDISKTNESWLYLMVDFLDGYFTKTTKKVKKAH